MLKNLEIFSSLNYKVDKKNTHDLVKEIREKLNFVIESISINFISGSEIKELNNKYLNHDYTTDIITFNYSGENHNLEGEIFISLDDAHANAMSHNISLDNEVLRLIIHGFLHLVGFDDVDLISKRKMKKVENELVKKFENIFTKLVLFYDSENC